MADRIAAVERAAEDLALVSSTVALESSRMAWKMLDSLASGAGAQYPLG